ncbi:MAG: right-handed parallel beta-helix repeat-containing protein [Planctomycetota bacterium]|jgi:hypothetical protein
MADYYVNSDVAGPGSGTIGDPIASNINSLSAGDNMFLRGGTVSYQIYDESEINITVDGSAGNEITIEPYQSELVEILKNSAGEAFDIDGDYITINGKNQLRINKNGTNGTYAIRVDGANVTLKDFEVYDISGFADALIYGGSSSSNGLIDGCTIHDAFDSGSTDCNGVALNGGLGWTVQNCTIYDCYGDQVYIADDAAAGYGWSILNNTLYTTLGECSENGIDAKWNTSDGRATIAGNTFYGFYTCTSTCGGSGDGDGEAISIHNSCDYVDVYDNIIYDCTSGITVEDGAVSIVVRNNLIYDLHTTIQDPNASSSNMGGIHLVNVNGVDVWNNTLHNCPVNSLIFITSLNDVFIQNNIFNDCGSIFNEGMSGKTVSYNCWFNCTETIVGTGDVTSDPLFADEGNDDYTLSSGSPCRDAGVDVGLPFRNTAPDMGAFEFAAGVIVHVTVVTVVVVVV